MLLHKACYRSARWLPPVAIALSTGCGNFTGQDADTRAILNLQIADSSTGPTFQESKSNGAFEVAEAVSLASGVEVVRGSVADPSDVDVFELGAVQAGDRVVVSMSAADALNGALAIFDESGAALLVNDHRNVYLGQQFPFIDVIFRRPSSRCYVAVTSTPGYPSSGTYRLGASVEPDWPIPAPRPDVVLLNFEGARDVRIASRNPVNVPTFDAADIDLAYSGQTDELIEKVVQMVREDFLGYDVIILSSNERSRPDRDTTQVHFGTLDYALLGVAEGVDEYNGESGQHAIVFTETFSVFMGLHPSLEEMAQAIANVASHEIGHLLGLVHTRSADDIMDVTASLRQLMMDQDFVRAPIYEIVFPIGDQDSARLLLDSVGGDRELVAALQKGRPDRSKLFAAAAGSPARESAALSTCALTCDHGGGHLRH